MEYIIVQAGGKGSRLGYLTKNKPKALVPVDNLPMLFHLFRRFPDQRFVIIADYQKEVLREYLSCFAGVKYQVVEAGGSGTCSGIGEALKRIPSGKPFLLIWSDLILADELELPELPKESSHAVRASDDGGYGPQEPAPEDYIGISGTFPCRWSYRDGEFIEERSCEKGVAGFFLFHDKSVLQGLPASGEFVRWLQTRKLKFKELSLAGTREFGTLEEYEKLGKAKCRPFNRIAIEGDRIVKEAVDEQGRRLAARECAWYERAGERRLEFLPRIDSFDPLKMEYIKGKNIYEYLLSARQRREVLEKLVCALKKLHRSDSIEADSFSMKEAYYRKTMERLRAIEDLIPLGREKTIRINGRECRNIYFYKRELEKRLEGLTCERFCFIHGDCTFSNLMLREDGTPVMIDPRGYFGFTELYGDVRYDWAKLYYSIVGNYDRFNLGDFRLETDGSGVSLTIASNGWEDMEQDFFALTGADEYEIKLIHAVIWLSLTTYAWQDYDSVCGAFYNGLYYLEEVL